MSKLPRSVYKSLTIKNATQQLARGKKRIARTILTAMRSKGCAMWPDVSGFPGFTGRKVA